MNPEYPLKFTPILKNKIWGGVKLRTLLHKKSSSENLGESWEISGVDGSFSVVSNGCFKGKTLPELIETYKEKLVGNHVYGTFQNKFPLLFKFIDAREDLSVQLHPNDAIAKAKHNSFGKSEMWYILQADENANLILGFNKDIDKEEYSLNLGNNSLESILQFEKVKKGDAFYITPGKIHAIGAGVLLAEIQQTSDITYRVYDWNRPDMDGRMRELHKDLAQDAIDYSDSTTAKINYDSGLYPEGKIIVTPYFSTYILTVEEKMKRDLSKIDSFVVYMCVEGKADIIIGDFMETVETGQTVLVPACCKSLNIESAFSKLLEIYVPETN